MKAILHSEFGDVSVLKIGETEPAAQRSLGDQEVCIQITASGLNRADLLQRQGHYPPPPGESEIIGLEASGHVLKVGAAVKNLQVGQAVMTLLAGGGYAEQVIAPEAQVIPIPPSMDVESAAAIPEAFITAHHNLYYLGQAERANAVLVHAGASGVGTAAIQLLVASGKQVYVTVGSPEKAAFCEKLGASPILYKEQNFAKAIKEKTQGKGIDIILDCIGAAYLSDNLSLLSKEGRLVLIGLMGGKNASIDLGQVLRQRLRIIGSTLRALDKTTKGQVIHRFWTHAQPYFEKGQLKPIIDSVYPANAVQEAHQRMEANLNTGKILLKW